jgi:magnesium transporter
MITAFFKDNGSFRFTREVQTVEGLKDAVWIDVLRPTPEEKDILRAALEIELTLQHPTIYHEDDTLFMTMGLVSKDEENETRVNKLTFILHEDCVVTLHEIELMPVAVFAQRIRRKAHLYDTPRKILWGLLFALSETVADRVEAVGTDLEQLSKNIAEMPTELGTGKTGTMTEISELLAELSRYEDFISQSGESVLQLARVVRYFNAEVDGFTDAELQARVNELAADVAGIKDHLAFEHDKVRYLQQASMGILNMQQNQIVKVFTILTAVFLPPTLVGTMYGMNFSYMPELSWKWGFPVTIALTFLSAILPLIYIKKKRWLR